MGKARRIWESRLSGEIDRTAAEFVQSLSFDKRLYKYDIAGSIAHSRMLSEQGIITRKEFNRIKAGLLKIDDEISAGKFRFNKADEDIHMAIEAALIKKIGETAKKMHTGRSRNDQVSTDMRLWMRDEIGILRGKIAGVQKAIVELAKNYTEDVMPAYTHLQRAQPVTIAAYLLSFVEQFERDSERLGNCCELLDVSVLGSGAIAGSTLPLDRVSTAKQLGFKGVSRNSIDAVSNRDFCAEFIFDCALISMHLSRLAEDWVLFSSNEFDYIQIADKFCTSSSMMPQKRNPDMLELIRAKTGTVYGALIGMLTILKGLPTGYNRDLQEDKIHVFNASDTVEASLDMAAGIIGGTEFNTAKISAGLDKGFLDATALAEYLVGKRTAFREAHGIVGRIVADCHKKNVELSGLKISEFKKYCSAIKGDVYKYLGAANVVKRYATSGSGGTNESKKQVRFWQKRLGR